MKSGRHGGPIITKIYGLWHCGEFVGIEGQHRPRPDHPGVQQVRTKSLLLETFQIVRTASTTGHFDFDVLLQERPTIGVEKTMAR